MIEKGWLESWGLRNYTNRSVLWILCFIPAHSGAWIFTDNKKACSYLKVFKISWPSTATWNNELICGIKYYSIWAEEGKWNCKLKQQGLVVKEGRHRKKTSVLSLEAYWLHMYIFNLLKWGDSIKVKAKRRPMLIDCPKQLSCEGGFVGDECSCMLYGVSEGSSVLSAPWGKKEAWSYVWGKKTSVSNKWAKLAE